MFGYKSNKIHTKLRFKAIIKEDISEQKNGGIFQNWS